jgi:TPR repeat protein
MVQMLSLLVLFVAAAGAETRLPGLPLSFDETNERAWVLAADQPPELLAAGAEPGWRLVAIDGVPFSSGEEARRAVARGGAREIRLTFLIPPEEPPPPSPEEAAEAPPAEGEASEAPPAEGEASEAPPAEGEAAEAPPAEGEVAEAPPEPPPPPEPEEVILVLQRAALVRVDEIGVLPWPEGFTPGTEPWRETRKGAPVLAHEDGSAWSLDVSTGALEPAELDARWERGLPEVFWARSFAGWALDRSTGLLDGDTAWARDTLGAAARASSFQGEAGEHLFLPTPEGLVVFGVEWPRGTPDLPMCRSSMPETCLASGKQILEQLGGRKGARQEATRQLTMACAEGIHRACTEALALQDERLAPRLVRCVEGDIAACNEVARERLGDDRQSADQLTTGLLEHTCDMESAGSLGERLRRLDQTGEGCVLLSKVYDARHMPDMALLNLDQACMLGRADACEEAESRRHKAFAIRIVRECQDETMPVASSCVELGRLLLEEEVPTSSLDAFDAFSRGCSLGAVEACILLGDFVDRWGIDDPRVVVAGESLKQACDAGEQRSCLGAAHLLVRHEPRTAPYGQALVLFDQACQEGLSEACVGGAEQRRIGRARRVDAPSPVEMWERACEQHNASGCDGLGERCARSRGTRLEAFDAWNKACSLGEPSACTSMGLLVGAHQRLSWPEPEPASTYLSQGCDNGDPAGCYWLAEANLPRRGEPTEPDYLLLERSCEGEFGEGCATLAQVHLDRKTSFDTEIAARHLDTACNRGHYQSCKDLGIMYRQGKGVERDRQRAKELLEKFRFNMPRKYLRVGAHFGLPTLVGAEGELVIPIPVGPAFTIGGTYSTIPRGGAVMMLLKGMDNPDVAPDLTSISLSGRVYPNSQARGLFLAVGAHQLEARGGDMQESSLRRQGLSVRVGNHSDTGFGYSKLEIGLFQLGVININDFDEDESGLIPLVNTAFSISAGLAI